MCREMCEAIFIGPLIDRYNPVTCKIKVLYLAPDGYIKFGVAIQEKDLAKCESVNDLQAWVISSSKGMIIHQNKANETQINESQPIEVENTVILTFNQ